MTRSLAVLAATLLATACSPEAAPSCPGDPVASFAFDGDFATSGLAPGLDPDPLLTDCDPAIGFPRGSPTAAALSFRGTLSADATGSGGALCRSAGPILFGTHDGVRWQVEDSADGAVLGGCGPTCAARSRVVITGDVAPDTTAPATFAGALVEQLTFVDGACGPCILPCAARYALKGTVEAP